MGWQEDKWKVLRSGYKKVTRNIEDRGCGWEVKDNRCGLETYDGVPTPAEWRRSDPKNVSISVSWIRAVDKGISITVEYWIWDWRWKRLYNFACLPQTGARNTLAVSEAKMEVGTIFE